MNNINDLISRLSKVAALIAAFQGHRIAPHTDFRTAAPDSPEGMAWARSLAVFEAVEGHPPLLQEGYTARSLRLELAGIIATYGDCGLYLNTPGGPQPVTSVDVSEDANGSFLVTLS